jgi:hypothetical protein
VRAKLRALYRDFEALTMNLLDPRFKYTPAVKTNVLETFFRHGFKITTEDERRARQLRLHGTDQEAPTRDARTDIPHSIAA